jgi:hypothetical protein
MSAASLASTKTRHPHLQFSLGGMMFTFLLGMSIGLAYWRWREVTFSGALLLSFTVWLVMGLIQRIQGDWGRLDKFREAPRQCRWGRVFQLVVPIWSIVLLAIVAASEIAWRYGTLTSYWPRWLADILFYLAIISAYWQPPVERKSRPRRTRVMGAIASAILLIVGAWWCAKIIANGAELFQMVYRSIRRIESAQPTTWAGSPFSAEPLTFNSAALAEIFNELSAAMALLSVAIAALGLMLFFWRSGRRLQIAFAAIWLGFVVAIACHLGSCLQVGPADLSPLRTPPIFDLRWEMASVVSILIVTAITAASLQVAAAISTDSTLAAQNANMSSTIPLHEQAGVIGFGLCAVLAKLSQNIWQNALGMNTGMNTADPSSWIADPQVVWLTATHLGVEYTIGMPQTMIHFAVALVLARCLWRRRLPDASSTWSVEPDKFIAAWIVSLVTLVIAAPVAVWWGVVATLLSP